MVTIQINQALKDTPAGRKQALQGFHADVLSSLEGLVGENKMEYCEKENPD